jgi:hypothetical protein
VKKENRKNKKSLSKFAELYKLYLWIGVSVSGVVGMYIGGVVLHRSKFIDNPVAEPFISFAIGALSSLVTTFLTRIRIESFKLKSKTFTPPTFLLKFIALLVPKQDRDNMFGDIDEGFPKLQKRIGRRMATIVYLKDIISMALPSIQKLVMKIGLVTGLWEFIKRKIL